MRAEPKNLIEDAHIQIEWSCCSSAMTAFVPLVLTWVFGADLLEKMADTKPEIKTTDAAAEGIDVDDQ